MDNYWLRTCTCTYVNTLRVVLILITPGTLCSMSRVLIKYHVDLGQYTFAIIRANCPYLYTSTILFVLLVFFNYHCTVKYVVLLVFCQFVHCNEKKGNLCLLVTLTKFSYDLKSVSCKTFKAKKCINLVNAVLLLTCRT